VALSRCGHRATWTPISAVLLPIIVGLLLSACSQGGVAPNFHGLFRYYDSSQWGPAVRLAVSQWTAAHVGVTFKSATDVRDADIRIVSSQSAVDKVAPGSTAFVSRIGIKPGQRATITLGEPAADPGPPPVPWTRSELTMSE
jgi:hypothetical protein